MPEVKKPSNIVRKDLIMEEERDIGDVKFADYKNWIRFSAVGTCGLVLYILIASTTSVAQLNTSYQLS